MFFKLQNSKRNGFLTSYTKTSSVFRRHHDRRFQLTFKWCSSSESNSLLGVSRFYQNWCKATSRIKRLDVYDNIDYCVIEPENCIANYSLAGKIYSKCKFKSVSNQFPFFELRPKVDVPKYDDLVILTYDVMTL